MSGGDIGNETFTTVQACKEYCATTEGCVAFVTTAGTENRCWLKNKQHGIEVANPIGISVRMNCDAEGKPMSPIYFITVLIVSVCMHCMACYTRAVRTYCHLKIQTKICNTFR